MTDFHDILDDALAESDLNWRATKPDAGSCRSCGGAVAPTAHPFRDAWLEPAELCDSCERKKAARKSDKHHRKELFGPRMKHCGAGSELRRQAKRHYGAGSQTLPTPLERLVRTNAHAPGDIRAVYLHGSTGAGKSTMAVAAIARFYRRALFGLEEEDRPESPRFWSARFVRLSAVFEEAKESFDDPASNWSWSRYVDVDFLVMDEVGREPANAGWVSRVVDRIINARYESAGLTLFTSNMTAPQLADRNPDVYDQRMIRRIMELCGDRVGAPHSYHVNQDHTLSHHSGEWS